jgi:hypothetical protein
MAKIDDEYELVKGPELTSSCPEMGAHAKNEASLNVDTGPWPVQPQESTPI